MIVLFLCPLQSLAAEDCMYTCFKIICSSAEHWALVCRMFVLQNMAWQECASEKLEGEECREPLQRCGVEL